MPDTMITGFATTAHFLTQRNLPWNVTFTS